MSLVIFVATKAANISLVCASQIIDEACACSKSLNCDIKKHPLRSIVRIISLFRILIVAF